MNIKYKIIKASPEERTILVRFYSDHATSTEEALAICNPDTGVIIRNPDGTIECCRTDYNITLWQVPVPSGQALVDLISSHAPHQWFGLLAGGVDYAGYAAIGASMGNEVAVPEPVAALGLLTEAEILAMVSNLQPTPTA